MCGIVGVITKNSNGLFKYHADIFKQMLFVDQLRGVDGVGLFYLENEEVQILKKATHASPLLVSKEFASAMETAVKKSPFLIGHNRAATRGEHHWKNTHPFIEDHITLVHNGTLFDHKKLDNTVEVDSHAICKHMAKETDADTLKEIDGAFALVWYNSEEKTLNLCRNKERPLYLIECAFCYLICSEPGLGKWIGERNTLTIVKEICLSPGIKYTFNMEELGGFSETEMTLRPPPIYQMVPHVQHCNNNNNNRTYGEMTLPAIKLIGATIQFKPCKIGKNNSAMLFDLVTNKHYLYGKVKEEPFLHIRVYGDPVYLKSIEDTPLLSGTITSNSRSNKAVTYVVNCVKEATATFHPNDLFSDEDCVFCTSHLRKDELDDCVPYQGGKLCPDCAKQFKEWNWDQ